MTKHVSFISFPNCVESQKEWILKKAEERLKKHDVPMCIDALKSFSLKKDYKELLDIVEEIVSDSNLYHFG